MVVSFIEITKIGAIFFQPNFGFLVLMKAKDEVIPRRRNSYFLVGLNFIIGGLVFIPSLFDISYSEVLIPFPIFPAYLGAL